MECGTLSQVVEAEYFLGEVTHPNGDHPIEPFLCRFVRVYQTRTAQRRHPLRVNHFALKSKLYLHAIHSAYAALRQLNPARLAA